MVKISASLLSANFASLGEEVTRLEQAGIDLLHLDIMDGRFVPNISFGADVVKSIRGHTSLPFDVHLMIMEPEKHIESFAKAGANLITIHPETTMHLDRTIDLIKSYGIKVGISLLPSSGINVLEYIIDKIDLVQVMTVNPGFSGQAFIEGQLAKISHVSSLIARRERFIELEVDGGINNIIAPKVISSGATVLVSGSYIFSREYSKAINSLKIENSNQIL